MSLALSVLYYALGQFVPDTYSPPLSLLSLQCGIGHFISRDSFGKPNCVTCPQGRFGVADGAVGLKGCVQCPRGKYQPNRGQGFCFSDHNSLCPAGTYNALARSDGPGRVVWQPLSYFFAVFRMVSCGGLWYFYHFYHCGGKWCMLFMHHISVYFLGVSNVV